jgi:hypothetical protein
MSMVHADVKAANVLLQRVKPVAPGALEWFLSLIDYGLAVEMPEGLSSVPHP